MFNAAQLLPDGHRPMAGIGIIYSQSSKNIKLHPMRDDIRWKQCFQNFDHAFALLREALEDNRTLSLLEKEGVIQRFEYCYELAWKTRKDDL